MADNEIDKTRNRFVTIGQTQMIYDAAGNLTTDQKFRSLQYAYDANGRMRRSDATTGYATSVYDASGQRVQTYDRLVDVVRQSVYDAFGNVVADYENGEWARDYIYTGGLSLATVEASGEKRYVLTDHQGSTRAVMNATQIIERHDYKPFGEELGPGTGLRTLAQGYGAGDPLRQQYGLTERDTSTGLDHAWFRNYESRAGRWTSPDPDPGNMSPSDPQSFNRYAYVKSDPVNIVDPTGLYWQQSHCYMEVRVNNEGQVYFTGREVCVYDWINHYSGSAFTLNVPGGNQQSTKEQRCLQALEDARTIGNRYSKTIADSLRAGVDARHHVKLNQMKTGLQDALRRIEINCNNHDKNKYSEAIKTAETQVNAHLPNIGDKYSVEHYKYGAAGGNVIMAVRVTLRIAIRMALSLW